MMSDSLPSTIQFRLVGNKLRRERFAKVMEHSRVAIYSKVLDEALALAVGMIEILENSRPSVKVNDKILTQVVNELSK